jgi:hypothetical protein
MVEITAKIYISNGDIIEVDIYNLKSLECSIVDRSDFKLPSFGIISNVANMGIIDKDGRIRRYAENLLLEKGLRCDIFLNNTLVSGATEQIGSFQTDEWEYDNDSRLVSIRLKDDLEEWQDINVPEISYDPTSTEDKPFSWIYEHLWAITNKNYPMRHLTELDGETRKALTENYMQYPMLKKGSLWQQWDKLCQVCQLHIYKDKNGIVVCRYNGGN